MISVSLHRIWKYKKYIAKVAIVWFSVIYMLHHHTFGNKKRQRPEKAQGVKCSASTQLCFHFILRNNKNLYFYDHECLLVLRKAFCFKIPSWFLNYVFGFEESMLNWKKPSQEKINVYDFFHYSRHSLLLKLSLQLFLIENKSKVTNYHAKKITIKFWNKWSIYTQPLCNREQLLYLRL